MLGKAPQLDPAEIEDVILGCAQPHGAAGQQRGARGRRSAPGCRHGARVRPSTASARRACRPSRWRPTRSSMKASTRPSAAASRASRPSAQSKHDPKYRNPWVKEHKPGIYMVMGDTAEVVAKRYKISREAQDEYSLLEPAAHGPRADRRASSTRSWRRSRSTRGRPRQEDGRDRRARGAPPSTKDECNRPDTTLEGLLALKPYFDPTERPGVASPPATPRSSPTAPRRRC